MPNGALILKSSILPSAINLARKMCYSGCSQSLKTSPDHHGYLCTMLRANQAGAWKRQTSAPSIDSIQRSVMVSISNTLILAFMMSIYFMAVGFACRIRLSKSMLSRNSIPEDGVDIWVEIRPPLLSEINTNGHIWHHIFLVSVMMPYLPAGQRKQEKCG